MKQISYFILVLLLLSSCTQRRYGHLTFRVHNQQTVQDKANLSPEKSEPKTAVYLKPKAVAELVQYNSPLNSRQTLVESTEIQKVRTVLNANNGSPSLKKSEVPEIETGNERVRVSDSSKEKSPFKTKSAQNGFFQFIGILIVVFLLLAALAGLGTILGISFWTGMKYLAMLVVFILILDLLGITEFWMGS